MRTSKSGAGQHVQSGEERELVERQHHGSAQCEARKDLVSEPGPRTLVEQDDQDAVDEQNAGPPDHQHAHLIEEAEIGDAVGRERHQCVVPHQVGNHDDQDVADQEAVDRLAHDDRVLVDIDQQQQHQLAGEQHRRPRRGRRSRTAATHRRRWRDRSRGSASRRARRRMRRCRCARANETAPTGSRSKESRRRRDRSG